MAQKPSIPKGTRDFSPAEMVKRNYIFDTIKEVSDFTDSSQLKHLQWKTFQL
jgi:histidyl-tRNA synthetase